MTAETGALVAALAKAQTQFAPVTRSKTVEVKTKTGGSYTFSYAPLDTILEAVRKPLADNGLAVMQMIDDGALVTSLMHESGAVVSGRVDIPQTPGIQEFGSAITYLRRYAIQALLGIAAEEDDDGNGAAGNIASPSGRSSPRPAGRGASVATAGGGSTIPLWRGPVSKGQPPVDGMLRQTPDGAAYGFALTDENGKRVQVLALGPLADALAIACGAGLPEEARVAGTLVMVPWEKDGKQMPPYRRVMAERIETPEWTLPAVAPAAPQAARTTDDEIEALTW